MGISNDDENVVDLTITTANSPLSLSARGSASASAAISTQRNDINNNNGWKRRRIDNITDEQGVISLLDDSSDDDDYDHNDNNGGGKLPPSSRSTRKDHNAKKRSRNQLPDDEQILICLDDDDDDTDTDLKKSSDPKLLAVTETVRLLVKEPRQPTSHPHNNASAQREHRVVQQSSPFATVAESYLDTTRNSLTHEEKRRNYDDARRPQENLYKDLKHLIEQRKILIRGGDVELHNVCQGEINRIRDEINIARKNAREDIFHANNSAGGMGIQIEQGDINDGSRINIDLHGQYVEDAKILFDEKVMPVLPVQKRVGVVTGRGKHSRTAKGQSKLRTGLVDHIRRLEEYRNGRMRYVSFFYKKNRSRLR